MTVATWNIYFLGGTAQGLTRTASDEQLIADVIERVAPDVLALQEIVDPLAMERILGKIGTETGKYSLRPNGDWLTSAPHPTEVANGRQKVFLCVNQDTVDVVRAAAIMGGPGGRRPYAAAMTHRPSGRAFVSVAVHLRSGFPDFLGADDAATRRREAEAISRWLRGEATDVNPGFPQPDTGDVLVVGDFNAELSDPNQSLDPLRSAALTGWRFENPAPDHDHWETALYAGDHYIIDFVMLSPGAVARVVEGPRIYAWDYDSTLGGPAQFHQPSNGPLIDYRVSDHRPVFVALKD